MQCGRLEADESSNWIPTNHCRTAERRHAAGAFEDNIRRRLENEACRRVRAGNRDGGSHGPAKIFECNAL